MGKLNKDKLLGELEDLLNIISVSVTENKKILDREIGLVETKMKSYENDSTEEVEIKNKMIKHYKGLIEGYKFIVGELDSIMEKTYNKITALQDKAEDIEELNILKSRIQTIRKEAFGEIKKYTSHDLEKMLKAHSNELIDPGDHSDHYPSLGKLSRDFLKEQAKSLIEPVQGFAKTMVTGFVNAVGYATDILTSAAKRIRSAIGITSTSNNSLEEIVNKFEEFIDSKPEKKDIELPEIKEMLPQQEILPARSIKISGDYPEKKASDERSNSNVITSKKWGSDREKSNFKDKIKYHGNNLTEVASHTEATKNTVNNESTIEKMENQVTQHS